jgi:hypothetical protein
MRHCRRGRVAVIAIDHGLYAICGEHLEGRCESWLGQRVRVFSDVQRAADALAAAVIADRLGDRYDVPLVERAMQGRAAMAAGAETDSLRAIR